MHDPFMSGYVLSQVDFVEESGRTFDPVDLDITKVILYALVNQPYVRQKSSL